MGLEKVRDEVLAKARKHASVILADAKKQEEQILSEAHEKASSHSEFALRQAEKELVDLRNRELASSELEVSKRLLDAKKKLMDHVYEEVTSRLAKFSPAKRQEHIRALLDSVKGMDIGLVLCNEKDLKFAGRNAQKADIMGGVIVQSSDGTVRIDLSYESLLQMVKEETLKDVANELFKEK